MAQISVIIPSHNRASLLPRALDSVLAQTLAPAEIIVVDDGSDDDTEQMLKACYPQVRVLRQAHSGVSAARNRGIRAARGEWLALLDSDDAWQPKKLARQSYALDADSNIRICHNDEIWIRNGRRINPKLCHAKPGGWIYRQCLPRCCISPSAALVHRSVLDAVGLFDEALPACEDYDLWLRITCHYPVLLVDEALTVKYGGHADQLSRRHWGMDRFRVRALEKILAADTLNDADRQATTTTLTARLHILEQGARKRKQFGEADTYANKIRRSGGGEAMPSGGSR